MEMVRENQPFGFWIVRVVHLWRSREHCPLLKDQDEHIRDWAVRLLADGIQEPTAETANEFFDLAKNAPSGLVRLYLAGSFPRFKPDDALKIVAALAAHDVG